MVAPQEGLHTTTVDADVETAVRRLKQAIKDSPAQLMTVFDHQENAEEAGDELPPTTVLVFGNPGLGTPILREYRTLALDLPQRMLVYEDNGITKIVHNDVRHLFERHQVDNAEAAENIQELLHNLVERVEE